MQLFIIVLPKEVCHYRQSVGEEEKNEDHWIELQREADC
jgi:hypothetical protein